MRLREKRPAANVALCFPDFPTYRKLIEGTRSSLKMLGVGLYLVSKEGEVSTHIPVRENGKNGVTDIFTSPQCAAAKRGR
jgi:hypothetical protein